MPIEKLDNHNKDIQMKYKSILTGEVQSLEQTIFESLFCVAFYGLFVIITVGFMYGGIVIKDMKCGSFVRRNDPDCNTEMIKFTRSLLFWSYVSILSSIFIGSITTISMIISFIFMPNKNILSGMIVYGFPLGYFMAYNLALFVYNNM